MITFPLVGEPLALDLVNTRPTTPTGTVDLLTTSAGLEAWLAVQAHRLPTDPNQITPADLAEVLALRGHITTAINATRRGRRPPSAVLQVLARAEACAARWREITWLNGTVTVAPRRHGSAGQQLLAELAAAGADLLIDPAVTTVRQCEGASCTLLFLPSHPRRRWCSPQLCGNRTRVARYYQRHKQT